MKKIFLWLILGLGFFGCGSDNSSGGITITVTGSDIIIPASATTSNVVKAVKDFDSTSYPQIKIEATFYSNYDGTPSIGWSDALSPDTRSVNLATLTAVNDAESGIIWLVSQTIMGDDTGLCTDPGSWANTYDVTVYYYTSASDYTSKTQTYHITEAEYLTKFEAAGITLADGVWGTYGWYQYTLAQANSVELFVDFTIDGLTE